MLVMLLSFTAAAILLVLLPGPDSLVVVRSLVRDGREGGVRTAAGVLCALMVWIAAACLGISALLQASRVGYDVLKIAGASYLVWMGWKALRTLWRTRAGDQVVPPENVTRWGRSGFVAGFMTDILNPKIGVTFVSLLPGFIPDGFPVAWTTLALGIEFLLLSALYFTALVAAARAITGWMTRPDIRRRLDVVTGIVLIGFGVRLATES